jgi:hypothetical protein
LQAPEPTSKAARRIVGFLELMLVVVLVLELVLVVLALLLMLVLVVAAMTLAMLSSLQNLRRMGW